MKLTFWGAAQVVTGSMHQLMVDDKCYLLDCGEYQGRRKEAEERNRNFPFPCKDVSAVMLSHAHIDHSGNLPLLVKNGFHGPIYTSAATADLCRPMLEDSASLQEHDAAFLNKRNLRRKSLGPPGRPRQRDPSSRSIPPRTPRPPFRSSTRLRCTRPPRSALAWFISRSKPGISSDRQPCCWSWSPAERRSGWVSRATWAVPDCPSFAIPSRCLPADYLIMESTYGNRVHEPIQSVAAKLAEIVNRTYRRGGKIIVPAFAVGRTQQLVLLLHELIQANAIPAFPIFVDSPLAVNVTEVFRKHPELYDDETRGFLANHGDPFGFQLLTYVRDVNQSKALNDLRGPFMVISASGMCEGGRVLHHLKNNIGDPRNTILLTGYQAEYTLGRKIEERREEVPIFGELMPLARRSRKAGRSERARRSRGNAGVDEAHRRWLEEGLPGPRRARTADGVRGRHPGALRPGSHRAGAGPEFRTVGLRCSHTGSKVLFCSRAFCYTLRRMTDTDAAAVPNRSPLSQLLWQYSYLQVLDFLTTIAFLVNGVREGNPLVRLALSVGSNPSAACWW